MTQDAMSKVMDKITDAANKEFNFDFDPCPLYSKFDGLEIKWSEKNFINPPYSRKLKEAFIHSRGN